MYSGSEGAGWIGSERAEIYVRGCHGCASKSEGIQGLVMAARYPQLSGDNGRGRNESLKEALKCSE